MDFLQKSLAVKSHIQFTAVDVTETARILASRHLCGPTAGLALAEGLTAAALLSNQAATPDEAAALHLSCDGPLQGLLVEALGCGSLRGYTRRKVLNDFDGNATIESAPAFGAGGEAHIIKTVPGRILNEASLAIKAPLCRLAVARYFNQSLQIPAAVEIRVIATPERLVSARGLLAERMPDTDPNIFIRVLEQFDQQAVYTTLGESADMDVFRRQFDLPDLENRERRELRFQCRCSRERALSSFVAFENEERQKIIASGEPQHVICHMCGEDYIFPSSEIATPPSSAPAKEG
jgi:molecular chaperone Hsp33